MCYKYSKNGINHKTIDVIWPFYKDQKFLNAAIKNLNNQTLKPNRLIFVDDANRKKDLQKILRKKLHTDIKLVFIKNEKNKGVTKSTEIGIKV